MGPTIFHPGDTIKIGQEGRMIIRTHFLDLPVARVMGIENGSGIVCSVGFVGQKKLPRMATKQTVGMVLGPVLGNLNDAQAGTLQSGNQ
jgi:hypothetical protein